MFMFPASEIEALKKEFKNKHKHINMSSCRLCFVTFLHDPITGNYNRLIDATYSDEIIDGSKSPNYMKFSHSTEMKYFLLLQSSKSFCSPLKDRNGLILQ